MDSLIPQEEERFVCSCGEVFDHSVWHCPYCDHHWDERDDECRNCHQMRLFVADRMNGTEARACVAAINTGIADIRRQVLDLHDREGWRALGYASWRQCVLAEFVESQSRIYQLLDAGRFEREVSTNVEIGTIPEGHLRQLTPLRDEPDVMREVWQHVHEEHGENVTAANVREAVQLRLSIPPRQPVAKNDSIHLALKHLSLATMIDPIDFIESAGGIEDIFMNNVQMLEQIERAQEWLRRYADALRQRLGVEPQQIRRVQ